MGRFDNLVQSANRATVSLRDLNDQMSRLNDGIDRAAATEFTESPRIVAPASFAPPPTGVPGTPTNPLTGLFSPVPPPTVLGPNGQPARTIGTGAGSSSTRSSSQFKLAENPLIPSMTTGAMLLYKSDLEFFLSSGVCALMELPSGGRVISCPWGVYPGLEGGVLQSTSASSGGSSSRGGSSGSVDTGSGGRDNSDRSRRFRSDVTNNPTGRQFGSSSSAASSASAPSSVSLDARPITERLDGLRSDVRELSRSLAGDGGASIRLRGGL